MSEDNKWISFAEAKIQQELQAQMEERWWLENFYGKKFTEQEWNEYLKNKQNKE